MKQKRIVKISIQTKIGIYFILFALLIINSMGWLLYYQSVKFFDEELGKNLRSIAKSASVLIDPELLSYIETGNNQGNFYKSLSDPLRKLQSSFKVRRIYIVDDNYRLLLDSDLSGKVGDRIPHLESNLAELQLTKQGKSVSSTLYSAYDGKLYKSAFAPVTNIKGNTVAIACVDASPSYLAVINQIEDFVLVLNLVSLLVAIFLSLILARTIVNPIKALANAAQKVSEGNYDISVKVKTNDELGFLGGVFNSMLENIREKEQNLRELSAAVSHEIRNPLNSISLYLGLLKRKLDNREQSIDSINKIQKEIETLNNIVSDFLSFSRNLPLEKFRFEVCELIEESLFLANDLLLKQNISVQQEINPQNLSIYGDKSQLKRVLLNLIINAVQASNYGSIIKLIVYKDTNIKIEVIDNGCGISQENMLKIFEPFFSTRNNGTGLGLSIIRNIISLHGGTIVVDSKKGIGTKFTIILPIE
jgi:signal transduction histidine kinase